ncbi:MAG: S49 family peptidase, partial [Pseudomonadota bacterium]
TFENTFASVGIYNDGVGTSELSGFGISRPIPPVAADLIQQTIEHGYEEFLTIVAEGRDMTLEEVDAIGQGRVWIGDTALELGLVDQLGDLEDAVASAAARADLEEYKVKRIREPLTPFEQFLMDIVDRMETAFGSAATTEARTFTARLAAHLSNQWEALARYNDPRGAYALCLACEF